MDGESVSVHFLDSFSGKYAFIDSKIQEIVDWSILPNNRIRFLLVDCDMMRRGFALYYPMTIDAKNGEGTLRISGTFHLTTDKAL